MIDRARPMVVWFVGVFLAVAGTSTRVAAQPNGSEQEYRAILAANPNDSRALYRLAELRREHPGEAVALLERYTALEPQDAWGYIALGDALGRAHRLQSAMRAFDSAELVAPGERDVSLGRARVLGRAGRTDDAIAAYHRWIDGHPTDAEALREIAALQRRAGRFRSAIGSLERAQRFAFDERAARQLESLRSAAATHVEPTGASSRDSDGNQLFGMGLLVGIVGNGVEAGFAGAMRRVSDGADAVVTPDARATLSWRPRATIRIIAEGGVGGAPGPLEAPAAPTPPGGGGPGGPSGPPGPPLPGPPGNDDAAGFLATGGVRVVWREAEGRARIDLRGGHVRVDASPLLLRNRVTRSEAGGDGQLRLVGPIALRAMARSARIESRDGDRNTRHIIGGGLAAAVPVVGEIAAGFKRMTYAHPSDAGYFAPRLAETAEVGAYREVELDNGLTLALDLGAGSQRVTEWSAPAGSWSPAFRGWASIGIPLAPGRELRIEGEAYDAQIGSEAATTAGGWRYGSLSVAVRWAVR